MPRKLTVVVNIFFLFVVVAAVQHYIGIGVLINALNSATPSLLILSFIFVLLWIICGGSLMYIVCRSQGIKCSFRDILVVEASGVGVNLLTPFSKIGGQPIAAKILSNRCGSDFDNCLGITVSKYGIDSLLTAVFGVISISYLISSGLVSDSGYRYFSTQSVLLILISSVLIVGLLYLFYTSQRLRTKTKMLLVRLPLVSQPIINRICSLVRTIYDSIRDLSSRRRYVFLYMLVGAVALIFHSTAVWISINAFGQQIPYLIVLLSVPVSSIIASITPVSTITGVTESALLGTVLLIFPSVSAAPLTTAIVYKSAVSYLLIGSISLSSSAEIRQYLQ